MKKLIAIILILVFLVQVIPIKEVAELLTSGQMTEDITHDGAAKKQTPNEEVHKKLYFHAALVPPAGSHRLNISALLYANELALINNLLQEVLIQPPDSPTNIA